MWRRLVLVLVIAAVGTALRPTGHVAACSCVGSTVAAAIAASDLAFVGTPTSGAGPGADGEYLWTFDVAEVVKGELPAEIEVRGSDPGMCGTDFAQFSGPVLVALGSEGDEYIHPGCSPVGDADDLLTALAPLEPPDGEGPVAALVAQRHRWSNIAALDRSGRVLSWGDLGGTVTAIAGCPGSDRAVAELWRADGSHVVAVVDLTTMTSVVEHPVTEPSAPSLTCVPTDDPDDPLVVRSGGGLALDGEAGVGSLVDGVQSGTMLSAVSDVVVLADGTAFAFPIVAGRPVVRFTGAELAEDDIVALADADVAIDAEPGPGDRLAVLVTDAVDTARFDTGATALALLDVGPDGALTSGARVPLPPGGAGPATVVRWLDADHLAVVRTTDSALQVDVIDVDGALVSRNDLPWGGGPQSVAGGLDGSLLRANNGGLERVARDGTVTPLTPAPASPEQGSFGNAAAIALVADGPTIPALRPEPPALHEPTGAAAPPDTTSPDDEPTTVASPAPATVPATAPATAPGSSTAVTPDDGSTDADDSDVPVVPIAIALAVAIAAGAVAVVLSRRPR
jgi:hypothetical protein